MQIIAVHSGRHLRQRKHSALQLHDTARPQTNSEQERYRRQELEVEGKLY